VYLLLYVDDMLFTSLEINKLKQQLNYEFELKHLGDSKIPLAVAINIRRDQSWTITSKLHRESSYEVWKGMCKTNCNANCKSFQIFINTITSRSNLEAWCIQWFIRGLIWHMLGLENKGECCVWHMLLIILLKLVLKFYFFLVAFSLGMGSI